jgi:hypothetical protein
MDEKSRCTTTSSPPRDGIRPRNMNLLLSPPGIVSMSKTLIGCSPTLINLYSCHESPSLSEYLVTKTKIH